MEQASSGSNQPASQDVSVEHITDLAISNGSDQSPDTLTRIESSFRNPVTQSTTVLPASTITNTHFLSLSLSARERVLRQHLGHLLMMAASHHHHHINANSAVQMLPAVADFMNSGPPPDEVAINMEQQQADGIPQGHTSSGQTSGSRSSASSSHRHRQQQVGEQIQNIPGLRTVVQNLEGAAPFVLLLLTKVMYNHRYGLLIFAAMLGTFSYANSYLKRLITLRDNQTWCKTLRGYVWIFGFLAANIISIYFIFSDQRLYRCLYFQDVEISDVDVWTLLWLVVITDFVVKFSTIVVKSVIALLPKYVLPYKRKGKYFLLTELISQFYRCLLPVKPWIIFLLDDRYSGKWGPSILLIVYCIFKAMHLRTKFLELRQAVARCRDDFSFGTSASKEEMNAFDNTCPICQDIYTDAVKLNCQHIFCDDCICLWLDREKTCPMCRAQIVNNPIWRDGSTSGLVQFY